MYPQGLATASGFSVVPFQLTILFISLLVTLGVHTSAFKKSISFPGLHAIFTSKLIIVFRLNVSSMILIKIINFIHKIDRRNHCLFYLNDTIITNWT